MHVPPTRGPLSDWAAGVLTGERDDPMPAFTGRNPLTDEDFQLALWLSYEVAFRGFDDVDDDREYDPVLLAGRRRLEDCFVAALRDEIVVPASGDLVTDLHQISEADGPSAAKFLRGRASLAQFREFVAHRSVYHLKEADPHTFAIPRLAGPAKAAFIEIQADEYGGGTYARMHSTLFADLMSELGLETDYGHYVASAPAITLATNNVMSLFGLHRRWRGAAAGHLAYIEMTSSLPSRRYGQALRRLGGSERACRFYDEHVEADAVHEQIALHDLCVGLAASDPAIADDIVFGAAAVAHLEAAFAQHLLDAWTTGRSSLLRVEAVAA